MATTEKRTSKLWTINEVAEYLGVSTEKAWEVVREHGVPFVHYGKGTPDLNKRGMREIRFRPEAVEQWAAKHEAYWGDAVPVQAPRLNEVTPPKSVTSGMDSWEEIAGPYRPRGPRVKKS